MKLGMLLSGLSKVRKVGSDSWIACCPAHEDRSPSMTIKATSETILLHCFAGCSAESILGALGMTFEDLYPEHERTVRPQSISPRAALECLSEESMLVAASGAALRQRPLTEAEQARLIKAAGRIQAAWAMTR